MPKIITDIRSWLKGAGERNFRYLVYKKMFTPYEEKNAFSDESVYEDPHYELCRIEEAINLGAEWMLGLRSINEDGSLGAVHYYNLNEIRLSLFDDDQDDQDVSLEEKNDDNCDYVWLEC